MVPPKLIQETNEISMLQPLYIYNSKSFKKKGGIELRQRADNPQLAEESFNSALQ